MVSDKEGLGRFSDANEGVLEVRPRAFHGVAGFRCHTKLSRLTLHCTSARKGLINLAEVFLLIEIRCDDSFIHQFNLVPSSSLQHNKGRNIV